VSAGHAPGVLGHAPVDRSAAGAAATVSDLFDRLCIGEAVRVPWLRRRRKRATTDEALRHLHDLVARWAASLGEVTEVRTSKEDCEAVRCDLLFADGSTLFFTFVWTTGVESLGIDGVLLQELE
jgi:hypothetical protein